MKIEGKNAVIECLESNSKIEKILASNSFKDDSFNKIINLAKLKNIKIQFVPNDVLNKESKTNHHQGLIAYTAEYKYLDVMDIINISKSKNSNAFIVVLDEITDPHNFGSIIRVCECLGVDGIIISKNRCCPVNETVVKCSAGAISYMPIAMCTNINNTLEILKENDIWIYGLELGGEPLNSTKIEGNVAVVIGSEGKGIKELTKKNCDKIVTIEMKGKVNSLNASVATGIVLYEISKLRI